MHAKDEPARARVRASSPAPRNPDRGRGQAGALVTEGAQIGHGARSSRPGGSSAAWTRANARTGSWGGECLYSIPQFDKLHAKEEVVGSSLNDQPFGLDGIAETACGGDSSNMEIVS